MSRLIRPHEWYLVSYPVHPENPYWWTTPAAVTREVMEELKAEGWYVLGPMPPWFPVSELQEMYEEEKNRGAQRTKAKTWFDRE